MLAAGIADYCATHPNLAHCQVNSTSNDIIGFVIAGLILAVIVFDLVWKFRFGSRGPATRLVIAAGMKISGLWRRSPHRQRSS